MVELLLALCNSIYQEVCYQYWPKEGEVTHGSYSIELSSETKTSKDIVTRTLTLINNEVSVDVLLVVRLFDVVPDSRLPGGDPVSVSPLDS